MPDDDRSVSLVVIETNRNESCDCSGAGFAPVAPEHEAAADLIRDDPFHDPTQECFCEVTQLHGEEREACQADETVDAGVDGWCYVDAVVRPSIGNAALVADCGEEEKRVVRFVGGAEAKAGSTRYVTCLGEL